LAPAGVGAEAQPHWPAWWLAEGLALLHRLAVTRRRLTPEINGARSGAAYSPGRGPPRARPAGPRHRRPLLRGR
jgi:hypothetical protein